MSSSKGSVTKKSPAKQAPKNTASNIELENQLKSLNRQKKQIVREIEDLEQEIDAVVTDTDTNIRQLEERKRELEESNAQKTEQLDAIGDVEFLNQQLEALTKAKNSKLLNKKGTFLDIAPFQRSGLLNKNESLAMLPTKIQQLHKEIDELTQQRYEIEVEQSNLFYSALLEDDEETAQMKEEKEEKQLQWRIDVMSPIKEAGKLQRPSQIEHLKREIFTLRMYLQNLQKSEQDRVTNGISLEEVQKGVDQAGGSGADVRQVGDNTFKIGNSLFDVKRTGKSLTVTHNGQDKPLNTFIMDKYAPPFESVTYSRV